MRDKRKFVLPFVVVFVALLGAAALLATAPRVATTTPDRILPTVRVIRAEPGVVRLRVRSQGTVAPRTESELIPEVSGPVVWISPALVSGGFFEQAEPLLRIDRLDYQSNVAKARAALARAEGEQDHAVQNLARRERLSADDISSTSQLDDARRSARVSEAMLDEARVALEQAQRDLDRTEVRAPFSGRVRSEHVDLGQFVSRGSPVATLYATDFVEIRLPIPDRELAYLNLPSWRVGEPSTQGPEVSLRATFAGREHTWQGRVVRTEGEIDAKSRMVHVVARVENPYGIEEADSARPPLAIGLFVRAEIEGPLADGITIVPRSALRDDRLLMVVDADDRMRLRDVDVMRIDREEVLIRTRLGAGERVCVSPLEVVVEGMRVRTVASDPADGAERPEPSDQAQRAIRAPRDSS